MEDEVGPTWQPISALGLIGSLIDAQVEGGRDQYQTLVGAADRPYVLDKATVRRVVEVYGVTAADLWLYDEQLARWDRQGPTAVQQREIDRLRAQMGNLHEGVAQILALAARLEDQPSRRSWPRATWRSGWSGGSSVGTHEP